MKQVKRTVNSCYPFLNKSKSFIFPKALWSCIFLMHLVEWFWRCCTSTKCISDMYGLSNGDWTSYLRLVGEVEKGYEVVQQVHLSILIWVKHGEKLSPWWWCGQSDLYLGTRGLHCCRHSSDCFMMSPCHIVSGGAELLNFKYGVWNQMRNWVVISLCSRIWQINVAVESTHCDRERNVLKVWLDWRCVDSKLECGWM